MAEQALSTDTPEFWQDARSFAKAREFARVLPKLNAFYSLQRAADSLIYKGDQWERGERAAARDEAVALLRDRARQLLDEATRA